MHVGMLMGKKAMTLQGINFLSMEIIKISFKFRLQLCASAPNKDSCQGDSGGPLIVSENNR